MALRATTPPNTADQPALSCTARRRKMRQAKTVLATEAGSPLHQTAAATEIFWTKPSTGTPKPVQEQVVIADDDGDDSSEDNADRMTAGRTWEGLEEDIAYCETEGLTHSASTCLKCRFSRSDVTLAVWWVRQWMADTLSAMNSTLELWSEFCTTCAVVNTTCQLPLRCSRQPSSQPWPNRGCRLPLGGSNLSARGFWRTHTLVTSVASSRPALAIVVSAIRIGSVCIFIRSLTL
ncbi:unnamed protein product [Polarella glacialis]|uniref:Uncharacterized protein n=1 Tax=Polarella glacialis TaxID=89957 RepID=A0A813FTS2_POLGL|nr:unnamed protein product [Polarella glacialis]